MLRRYWLWLLALVLLAGAAFSCSVPPCSEEDNTPCVGGQICKGGKCQLCEAKLPTPCLAPSGSPRKITCVNLLSNVSHCGKCGVSCPEKSKCIDGSCQKTQTPPTCTSSACPLPFVCKEQKCVCPTTKGFQECGGACINTQTAHQHCGKCGHSCRVGELCLQGKCHACQEPEGFAGWVRRVYGRPGSKLTLGALATDDEGNTWLAGSWRGTLIADSQEFTSDEGSHDFFVIQFDHKGTLQWFVRGEGPRDEAIVSIVVGPDGSSYILGHFTSKPLKELSTLEFKSADMTHKLALETQGEAVFLARLSKEGKFLWRAHMTPEDVKQDSTPWMRANALHYIEAPPEDYLLVAVTHKHLLNWHGPNNGATLSRPKSTNERPFRVALLKIPAERAKPPVSDLNLGILSAEQVISINAMTARLNGAPIVLGQLKEDILINYPGPRSFGKVEFDTELKGMSFFFAGTIERKHRPYRPLKAAGPSTGHAMMRVADALYVTGQFAGAQTYTKEDSLQGATLKGSGGAFLAKFNLPNGNEDPFLWALRVGTGSHDTAMALAANEKSLYLAGLFTGESLLAGSEVSLKSDSKNPANKAAFIARLDPEAKVFRWRVYTKNEGGAAIHKIKFKRSKKRFLFLAGEYTGTLRLPGGDPASTSKFAVCPGHETEPHIFLWQVPEPTP